MGGDDPIRPCARGFSSCIVEDWIPDAVQVDQFISSNVFTEPCPGIVRSKSFDATSPVQQVHMLQAIAWERTDHVIYAFPVAWSGMRKNIDFVSTFLLRRPQACYNDRRAAFSRIE